MAPKSGKDDLYALKRKMLKEKRKLMNQIIGNDEVDGSTFQRHYGEATKTRRALKIEMFGSKSKSSKYGEDTSIEVFVQELLKEWDIKFIPQKCVRYINVDIFLPDYNLAIETCGGYWHCDLREYSSGPKNNIQKKNIEKDRISKEIVLGEGIHRLEIWELDIKTRPEVVREKLKMLLNDLTNKKDDGIISVSSADW